MNLNSFWSLWEFCKLHPGIVFVVVGVIGEGIGIVTEHSEKNRLKILELFFWSLVVIGLVMEMFEAANSDNEVLALNKKVDQANPLNQPIKSVRVDVFLLVRGDFSDPVFFERHTGDLILPGMPPLQGELPKDGALCFITGNGGA